MVEAGAVDAVVLASDAVGNRVGVAQWCRERGIAVMSFGLESQDEYPREIDTMDGQSLVSGSIT